MKKLLLNFILLFCSFTGLTFSQSVENFTIKHYSSKNGLPQNSIRSMLMDDNRYLWMTTEGGIVRFDGQFFKIFNHYNTPEILNDRFSSVLKTQDGKYLTFEQSRTVFEIKNGNLVLIQKGDRTKAPTRVFKGAIPDLNFLLKNMEGVYVGFDKNDFNEGLVKVFPLGPLKYGVLLKDCIRIFKEGNVVGEKSTKNLKIAEVFYLNGFIYFINSNKEFFYYNDENNTIHPVSISGYLSKKEIENIIFQRNLIWSYGYPDVYLKYGNNLLSIKQNKRNDQLKMELVTANLPVNTIISDAFYDEKSNNLFIGTETKGLYVFRKNKIHSLVFNSMTDVSNNSYYSQCELDSGVVMTWQNREFTIEGGRKLSIPLHNISHEFLLKDRHENVWATKADSIIYYNLKTKEYNGISPIKNGNYYTMKEEGDSLIVGGVHGIGYIKNGIYQHLFPYNNSNPDSKIEDVIRGPDGNFWIARCSGVSIQNIKTGKEKPIKELEGICARTLFLYDSKMYIGSYGDGYYVWSDGKIYKMPNDRSNYLSHVHSFLVDKKNRLWMSTNKGLLKTNLENIDTFIKNGKYKFSYQVYGEDEGILNSEFNGGCSPSVLRLSTGYVSYPTMEGMVWLIPEEINDENPDEELIIDELVVNQKSIDLNETIQLPPNQESVKITFSAPYWGNPLNLNMEYMLEGFNKDWTPIPPGSNSLLFSNLHSGTYNLKIRKLTGSSDALYNQQMLTFTVDKKFYETTPFILLSIVASMLLLLLILKLNSKRILKENIALEKKVNERTVELRSVNQQLEENFSELEKKEQFLRESINVKDRLISVISHDIITPLKFISMVSRISKKNPDMIDRNKLIESMNDIEFASDKLYNNAS
ncbi:MAG TPA: triple tyrosine motif-containing protein, partial [Bacteroidia bacterium]|nr:triple tyrosine motif-containing protein [Bacteroidia bacterium]